jgi:hypothetical protein
MASSKERSQAQPAVTLPPESGEHHYLTGARAASAGDYTRAVNEMTLALSLNPTLHTARLQLGLLHLTMAEPARALAMLAPLESSGDEALTLFKRGLEALIHDDFAACVRHLESGMRLNTTNAPLNHDMGLLADRARAAMSQSPTADKEAVRTDFSLYEQPKK